LKSIAPALLDVLAGRPAVLELDQAALEIARLHDPRLDSAAALRVLDQWAQTIGSLLPAGAGGAQFLNVAHRFLFGQMNLLGDADDYFAPENSCLHLALAGC
jgi:regulator of sirC expression with transglutaminase-like and TPR domain